MIKTVQNAFRKQLMALSERIRGKTRQMRAELPPRSVDDEQGAGPVEVPIDPTELGAHLSEEEVLLTIVGGEERLLPEIDAATDRIDKATFGRCEKCGESIARERLRAVPYTRFCIHCSTSQGV